MSSGDCWAKFTAHTCNVSIATIAHSLFVSCDFMNLFVFSKYALYLSCLLVFFNIR